MVTPIFQIYLGTDYVDQDKASKILSKINSMSSAKEMMEIISNNVNYGGFAKGTAQRIFDARAKVGRFQNLNQVATTHGIGRKKFGLLISALADCG
jgi:DNA uptake protein ComE-like DNA-binding protein